MAIKFASVFLSEREMSLYAATAFAMNGGDRTMVTRYYGDIGAGNSEDEWVNCLFDSLAKSPQLQFRPVRLSRRSWKNYWINDELYRKPTDTATKINS